MVFRMFAVLLRTLREYQTSLRKLWQNFGHLLQRIMSVLQYIVFHKVEGYIHHIKKGVNTIQPFLK